MTDMPVENKQGGITRRQFLRSLVDTGKAVGAAALVSGLPPGVLPRTPEQQLAAPLLREYVGAGPFFTNYQVKTFITEQLTMGNGWYPEQLPADSQLLTQTVKLGTREVTRFSPIVPVRSIVEVETVDGKEKVTVANHFDQFLFLARDKDKIKLGIQFFILPGEVIVNNVAGKATYREGTVVWVDDTDKVIAVFDGTVGVHDKTNIDYFGIRPRPLEDSSGIQQIAYGGGIGGPTSGGEIGIGPIVKREDRDGSVRFMAPTGAGMRVLSLGPKEVAILTGPDMKNPHTFYLQSLVPPNEPPDQLGLYITDPNASSSTPTKVGFWDAVNGVFGVDGKVTARDGLYLRPTPKVDGNSLGLIPFGEGITITGVEYKGNDVWYQIRQNDGGTAYIAAQHGGNVNATVLDEKYLELLPTQLTPIPAPSVQPGTGEEQNTESGSSNIPMRNIDGEMRPWKVQEEVQGQAFKMRILRDPLTQSEVQKTTTAAVRLPSNIVFDSTQGSKILAENSPIMNAIMSSVDFGLTNPNSTGVEAFENSLLWILSTHLQKSPDAVIQLIISGELSEVSVGGKIWKIGKGVNLMFYEIKQANDPILTTNAGGLGWGYNVGLDGVLNITPMVLSITENPALNDPVRTTKTIQSLQELAYDLDIPATNIDKYSLIPQLYRIMKRTGVQDGKPFTSPFIHSN